MPPLHCSFLYSTSASNQILQTPSKEKSFAETGARLSFQKRTNDSLQNSFPSKDPVTPLTLVKGSKSSSRENQNPESVPEPNLNYLASPGKTIDLQRSNSSGALQ